MKDCREYQEHIGALLDGELTEAEAAEVKAHMASCEDCRAMYEALCAVSSAMAGEPVPEELHGKIMSRVKAAAKASSIQGKIIRLRRWGGLAACLIVAVGIGISLKNQPGMGKAKSADNAASEVYMLTAGAGAADAVKADSAAPEAAEEFSRAASMTGNAAEENEAPTETEDYDMSYNDVKAADCGFDATGALDCAETVILTVDAWEADCCLATVTVPNGSGFLTPGTAVRVYLADRNAESVSGHFLPGCELAVLFRDYNDAAEPLAILALELSDHIN